MTKNDIVNELNKMGYEVREENVVKNGVEFLGISIIDSDRYMIPVFYVEDIITKAEQSGATVKEIVRDMLKIHNDALRESEELNKPIHFNREDFLKRLYVGVQKESKEDIVKCKTEFEGIEKYLFLRMEALNDAIVVLEDPDATQIEVDAAYEALIRAYLDLRLIPNKDLLQELINKAQTLSKANYTAASWKVMNNALDEAIAVLNNLEATQEEVKMAESVLNDALNNLVENNVSKVDPINTGDSSAVKTGDNTFALPMMLTGLLALAGSVVVVKKKKD